MTGVARGLALAVGVLVTALLLTFPYIDLAVKIDLLGRQLDTPLADLAGAALVPVVMLACWLQRSPLRPPGLVGYTLLLSVGILALATVPAPGAAAWYLLRKPVFLYVAYGVALAWAVGHVVTRSTLRRILLTTIGLTALVSLATSVGRIAAGNTLWFAAIEGLTNNHKTLAVALAPLVPLILSLRRGRMDLVLAGLAIVAIALSLSRTAWISTAVGLAFFVVWQGRALASRRGLLVGVVVVGVLASLYGPLLMRSNAQLDAARSRHSLDTRAWQMAAAHPVLGMGGGASVRFEMQAFPHYRINGVDAHGAVQKVLGEYGGAGLAGYLLFVGTMAIRLRRRAALDLPRADGLAAPNLGVGIWATFVALHVNLLLSTETFSQTHWIPLGIAWGLSHRRAE